MKTFIVPISPMRLEPQIQTPQNQTNVSNGFSNVLNQAIENVKESQQAADQSAQSLLMGQSDDLHNVMIQAEQAALALELTVQVTSKAINAYNEIMRMQF
jgi:flagellar hook-basal body complex protein FliE